MSSPLLLLPSHEVSQLLLSPKAEVSQPMCLPVSPKAFVVSFILIKVCDDKVWFVNYKPFFINVIRGSK